MQYEDKLIRIDGVKWRIESYDIFDSLDIGDVSAVCPRHHLKLTPSSKKVHAIINGASTLRWEDGQYLHCDDGDVFVLPRIYSDERRYILRRIEGKLFSKMATINLDDEAVPISKTKLETDDGKYFLTAQLMKSKRGVQVVVYAGEKGRAEKTEIIIEPEVKRLAFDHTDLNPNDIFIELRATFVDGSVQVMRKGSR